MGASMKTIEKEEMKASEWKADVKSVAGGNRCGENLNQLHRPNGLFIDKSHNIFIADCLNHRIMKWEPSANEGEIVAGGTGIGNRMNQLNRPTDVIVDEQDNSLIIADRGNRRVIRWWSQNNQEILINDIQCSSLTRDKDNFLYVCDDERHEVKRWTIGDTQGKVVGGGNGRGNQLNQFDHPHFIFVDDEQSIYISDLWNHRVMKWKKDAHEGVIVAGGNGSGDSLSQLNCPTGVIVDDFGQVYIADYLNQRIMRWRERDQHGEIIIGGDAWGEKSIQLSGPSGISFDIEGNLYVVDSENHQVQRFDSVLLKRNITRRLLKDLVKSKLTIICLNIPLSSTYFTNMEYYENDYRFLCDLSNIKQKQIRLILPIATAKDLVPLIHNYHFVEFFYILSSSTVNNDEQSWIGQYPKIFGIFDSQNEIVKAIHKSDSTYFSASLFSERDLVYSLYTQTICTKHKDSFATIKNTLNDVYMKFILCSDYTTDQLPLITQFNNSQYDFLSFQLMFDILYDLPSLSNPADKDMISCSQSCRVYHKVFDTIARNIQDHSLADLIDDSRDISASFFTFIEHLYKHGLSMERILTSQQLLVNIRDVINHLEPCTSPSTVYCVQLIKSDQTNLFENQNHSTLITFHSHLLASRNILTTRTIARELKKKEYQSVILEIYVPKKYVHTVHYIDTDRIVFHLGSIFQIHSTELSFDGILYIKSNYILYSNDFLKEQIYFQTQQNFTWFTFGTYLSILKKYDDALVYYRYILDHVNLDNSNRASKNKDVESINHNVPVSDLEKIFLNDDRTSISPLIMNIETYDEPTLVDSKRALSEYFTGVWFCDHQAEIPEDTNTELNRQLRELFTSFYIIDNTFELFDYIKNEDRATLLCLIVSSKYGEYIIDTIRRHNKKCQFIYRFEYELNDLHYQTPIFTNIGALFEKISTNIQQFNRNHSISTKDELRQNDTLGDQRLRDLFPGLSIYNFSIKQNPIQFFSEDSLKFLLFQTLTDIICEMNQDQASFNDLICECRGFYHNNPSMWSHIEDFKVNYKSSSQAIFYYTQSQFLYRTLSRAYRSENIENVYQCRKFIADLHRNLEECQRTKKKSVQFKTLYRGSKLPRSIIQQLIDHRDHLISINGFVSTTTGREVAQFFSGDDETENSRVSVVYEMSIDQNFNRVFANIREESHFGDEDEVLMATGTVWKTKSVVRQNNIWTITLESCDKMDSKLRKIKRSLIHGSSLLSLADILRKQGDLVKAERFYKRTLNDDSFEEKKKGFVYSGLGMIYLQREQIDEAVKYLQMALPLLEQQSDQTFNTSSSVYLFSSDEPTTRIQVLHNIGLVYQKNREYDQAFEWYKKALKETKETSNTYEKAVVCYNIGRLFITQGRYYDAYQYYKQSVELTPLGHPKRRTFQNALDNVENLSSSEICPTATWSKDGITVAGGKDYGRNLDQLAHPFGIFLDDNDTIYIADHDNDRIVKWEQNATVGQWVAGVKGDQDGSHQFPLFMPDDIVVDKNGTIYISDGGNHRVVRWHPNKDEGEVLIDNIQATGIGQDNQGFIYVSEYADGTTTKWDFNDDEFSGEIVASKLRQSYLIFIDQKRTIYSTGYLTHRIVKIAEGEDEPSLVAGQSDRSGDDFDKLDEPSGVYVDEQETVYIADQGNNRIMRWLKDATNGTLIAGGNGRGSAPNQFDKPSDVFLDRQGNLYVTDMINNRVQKFLLDKNSCQ
ncbi:unnamed protein product [Adineta ricciae]|nr:unnamed protein product [Adineta ricciae]